LLPEKDWGKAEFSIGTDCGVVKIHVHIVDSESAFSIKEKDEVLWTDECPRKKVEMETYLTLGDIRKLIISLLQHYAPLSVSITTNE